MSVKRWYALVDRAHAREELQGVNSLHVIGLDVEEVTPVLLHTFQAMFEETAESDELGEALEFFKTLLAIWRAGVSIGYEAGLDAAFEATE